MRLRNAAGVFGIVVALAVAGCHRRPPEPAPATEENEAAPAAPLPPATPVAPAPETAPAAPPPPAAPKPPPPPPVSADQQMRDDAAASGMTAPIETGNDEAEQPGGADANGEDPHAA